MNGMLYNMKKFTNGTLFKDLHVQGASEQAKL